MSPHTFVSAHCQKDTTATGPPSFRILVIMSHKQDGSLIQIVINFWVVYPSKLQIGMYRIFYIYEEPCVRLYCWCMHVMPCPQILSNFFLITCKEILYHTIIWRESSAYNHQHWYHCLVVFMYSDFRKWQDLLHSFGVFLSHWPFTQVSYTWYYSAYCRQWWDLN